MSDDPIYYACAIAAVAIAGLSKGGFSGIGVLCMPIMAIGIAPVRGAAILLPVLLLQDAIGVWNFRKNRDSLVLKAMLPGMTLGRISGVFIHVLRT